MVIALNPVIAFVCSWVVFFVLEFKEKKKAVFKFTLCDFCGLALIFFTTFFWRLIHLMLIMRIMGEYTLIILMNLLRVQTSFLD